MAEINRADLRKKIRKEKLTKWGLIGLGITLVLVILLSVGMYFINKNHNREVLLRRYPVQGVMIDQDDGYVDFTALKQKDQKFVYIRSTQGASFADDNFDNNYNRSQGSGLKIGVYHTYGFKSSIKDQENNFVTQVKDNTGTLPIVIQVQYYYPYSEKNVNFKQQKQRINELVQFLYRRYSRPVIINTNEGMYQEFKSIPHTAFWLNSEDDSKDAHVRFVNMDSSDHLTIDGQRGSFDSVAFNGNQKQWNQYLGQVNIMNNEEMQWENFND
ncbi:GH25 family lysozyme [Fructilactobacillus fructivorans]|uniref:Lysozyme n=1 Tax=Fructilactobacillus fructivorans TaxID=1614 RepID=A0AAE6P083_9LACO|nr:GH25 family lysozyme [Fructilactobacillus fructivorans]KRK57068.1 glycoside hydrolase family 25 [Fructilactobacillus fructivorans]QFX92440.1 lysozyme [Fructilactobacillus fructivorans]RDV64990.1 lysozyme [Fructilactobacillus fructivorans]